MDHAFRHTASLLHEQGSGVRGLWQWVMLLIFMSCVILDKFFTSLSPQFLYLSGFVKGLSQHLEGAKQMLDVRYYTVLLVEDSKSQAREVVKAIV